jgi:uncharacterized protein (TIGR02266 family)
MMQANEQTDPRTHTGTGAAIRREHDRLDMELEVGIDTDHKFFTGFTQNISAGGLFVATHDVLPIGARFRLTFRIPGADREFMPECEVRWVRQTDMGDGMSAGMGVRFVDMSPADEALIDDYISTRETLFYDDDL